jgi:hypothetical protein
VNELLPCPYWSTIKLLFLYIFRLFVPVDIRLFDQVIVKVDVVDVGVADGVCVGVLVGVAVGVFVGVEVSVLVGVAVGVAVGVCVGVCVGVGQLFVIERTFTLDVLVQSLIAKYHVPKGTLNNVSCVGFPNGNAEKDPAIASSSDAYHVVL